MKLSIRTLRHTPNRYSAALLHFVSSLILFAVFLGVLTVFWYPSPYFSAAGGWQGLRLVAAVDLVLGPLMTLVIYNPQKSRRELSMDIGLIVLLQLAALAWGIKSVYEQRPVAVVFLDNSFYTVPATAITEQGVALNELQQFGTDRPVYVYVSRPSAGEDLVRFERAIYEDQIPPHEQVWLYQSIAENFAAISRSSLNIEEVMTANADMRADIEELLHETGTALNDNYYVALTSRYRNIILVFNRQGEIIGTVSAPFKSGEL